MLSDAITFTKILSSIASGTIDGRVISQEATFFSFFLFYVERDCIRRGMNVQEKTLVSFVEHASGG